MREDREMTEEVLPLQIEKDGAIVWLRFNRPEVLNALDQATAESFRDACLGVASDKEARVLIIAGRGRGFMAGGDVSKFSAEPDRAGEIAGNMIEALHNGLEVLDSLTIPVIASVQGPVAGAGFSLAAAVDLCIAADNASFTLAYARIGATPDGSGSWNLPRLVGQRRALQLALLAESIDAATARDIGIVNYIVPAADLESETRQLAGRLASGPTAAYGRIRHMMRQSWKHDLAEQLAIEKRNFQDSTLTSDFREGVQAFMQKRRAVFLGH
jgi:2-(1,2-epoxy-1,2-dihydrophenyl)acetyl-CoA isomerase